MPSRKESSLINSSSIIFIRLVLLTNLGIWSNTVRCMRRIIEKALQRLKKKYKNTKTTTKINIQGRTPLHVAVESHDPAGSGVNCVGTTRLLLENGADVKIKETKCGDTALHMAVSLSCDPALVKVHVVYSLFFFFVHTISSRTVRQNSTCCTERKI